MLWLAPTIEAEEEAFVKEVEQNVLRDKRESLYKILKELEEYHPKAPCWYVPIIAVDSHYQNNGIGSLLMKRALSIKSKSDAKLICLTKCEILNFIMT